MQGAQKPINFEGVNPVHDVCYGAAFDAFYWYIVLPRLCLVREVKVQYEIGDPWTHLIKRIPSGRRILETKPSELARWQKKQLRKWSEESAAAAELD